MKTSDARKLRPDAQEALRKRTVAAVRKGMSVSEASRVFGVSRWAIHQWLTRVEKGGSVALNARKRGRRSGGQLAPKQLSQVARDITDRCPDQLKLPFALWTRAAVQQLIATKFGVAVSVWTVGRYLQKMGFTPQKPLRRAYERDPVAIAKWKTEDYPKLRARAQRRGADIFFLDEAGIRSDAPLQRTWGPKGKTPEVSTSGQRQSVSAISAVNVLGAFWYDVYTGRFTSVRFVEFLRAFLRTRRRAVFLVVDGHPTHRAKVVARYVQSLKGKLEVHFLPGYAPELNPDEFVWNYIRQHGVSKKPLKQNESLRARVEHDLQGVKNSRSLVRAFFDAPSVVYITD